MSNPEGPENSWTAEQTNEYQNTAAQLALHELVSVVYTGDEDFFYKHCVDVPFGD